MNTYYKRDMNTTRIAPTATPAELTADLIAAGVSPYLAAITHRDVDADITYQTECITADCRILKAESASLDGAVRAIAAGQGVDYIDVYTVQDGGTWDVRRIDSEGNIEMSLGLIRTYVTPAESTDWASLLV